jgi:hypothetical protein
MKRYAISNYVSQARCTCGSTGLHVTDYRGNEQRIACLPCGARWLKTVTPHSVTVTQTTPSRETVQDGGGRVA